MKTKFSLLTICAFFPAFLGLAQDKPLVNAPSPDRLSIFQAPLQCPAAPQIGCGSRAKPMLLELERNPSVSEAWLNRAGTQIALVWKPQSKPTDRNSLAAQLKEHGATELKGKDRSQAIDDFQSGKGWYRGADVDRLSEEEARIIAARLVHRVEAKTTLSKDKAQGLQLALSDAISKRFTDEQVKQSQDAMFKSEGGLQQAVGQYLDKDQVPILKEAIEAGWRPLPDEK